MRVLLDNDVPILLARFLNERGHDAVTARDLGTQQLQDFEQLVIASRDDRVFISHNGKDFRLLDGAWKTWTREWNLDFKHSGIVILPQSTDVQKLADFIDDLTYTGMATAHTLYQLREGITWEPYALDSRLR